MSESQASTKSPEPAAAVPAGADSDGHWDDLSIILSMLFPAGAGQA
jgi:hypothetical protein